MRLNATVNGGHVAAGILNVTRVPYYEIIGDNADAAMASIDDAFSRMLSDFARRAVDSSLALELLLISEPVSNQLYRAQPHIFLIVRKLGKSEAAATKILSEALRDIRASLTQLGYASQPVAGDDTADFAAMLAHVECTRVVALTREELAFALPNGSGYAYYNDPLPPDPIRNLSVLTNALAEHPRAAYSLQLVPTAYTPEELNGIEQRRMLVDMLRKQIMMTPGGTTPTAYINASKAYLDFIERSNESVFYFMLAAYSGPSESESLVNKLLGMFAGSEQPDVHMVKPIDISAYETSLEKGFLTKPWALSDTLVFQARNRGFWQQPNAPRDLFRVKQLATFSTVKFAIRLPFDDGSAVGLDANRNDSAREKLDDAVLSSDSLRIGTITDAVYSGASADGSPPQAGIPFKDLTKHGMIVGKSGSGKTNFVHTMLIRLAQAGVPFMAIEPTKTEYRCLKDAIGDLTVFTPGMNGVSPFIINPFIPPVGVTVESYVPCLMSAFETAFTMPDPLPSIFREVINKTYNKYGWKLSSTCEDPHVTWFGFHEMIRVFQDHVASMDYEGEVRSNISTAGVLRLSSLIEQNSNIYDTTPTIPVHELLKQPVVIELNAITAKEQKTLLMALLLVAICNYTKFNTAPDGALKNILLIDEAHVLFGAPSREEGTANRAAAELEDMIAEIRAYGTGVFVADQTPATFGAGIIANTDTKIMFQVVEKGGKDTLEAATGLSSTKKDLLSKLRIGECLLYYSRLPEPILVMADEARKVARYRSSIPNEEVRDADTFWPRHRELLMPFAECRACPDCRKAGCDLDLRSTTEFIASRMANFYLPYIKGRESLDVFVKSKAKDVVRKQLDENGISSQRARAGFCVMARFIRKVTRAKRLDVAEADLARYIGEITAFGSYTPDSRS
ncbi:MAG: ATP-binding protein [Eggerthellaceae bacterium]|nr:ATP-binding protein [Eggerthellaceae bacterium]